MKKKILFLVTVLAFMVAMPIASAEVLEAKDVTTLVEMVKKAKDGDTVKLTADITGYDQKLEINGKRTITLDMNGHNITYLTGSKSFIGVYGATLIVKGSGVITNDTDSGLNVYGKETKGLPEDVMKEYLDKTARIPMLDGIRCLNLSNSVAIIAYEILRQHNFQNFKEISDRLIEQ